MREIVFDTETTGISARNGDRVVEIGCIELINRTESGRTFHCYLNPERDMPAEVEAVHGLSARFLSDKPLFAEKVEEFLEFLGDAPLIAHNATFDFDFIDAELVRVGRPVLDRARMIDTLALARSKHPGGKHGLDALCVRYGVDRSHRVKHGALLDAELLAQVYIEMHGGRQIGLGLVADEPAARDDAAPEVLVHRPSDRPFRAPRPHAASAAELERHQAFIATLKAPIWQRAG